MMNFPTYFRVQRKYSYDIDDSVSDSMTMKQQGYFFINHFLSFIPLNSVVKRKLCIIIDKTWEIKAVIP